MITNMYRTVFRVYQIWATLAHPEAFIVIVHSQIVGMYHHIKLGCPFASWKSPYWFNSFWPGAWPICITGPWAGWFSVGCVCATISLIVVNCAHVMAILAMTSGVLLYYTALVQRFQHTQWALGLEPSKTSPLFCDTVGFWCACAICPYCWQ